MRKAVKHNCVKVASLAVAIVMAAGLANTTLFASANIADGLDKNKTYKSDYNSFEETIKAGEQLNLELAAEGFTLLKNRDNALPLAATNKVVVLGSQAKAPSTGGGGSGGQSRPGGGRVESVPQKASNIYDALDRAQIEYNKAVQGVYENIDCPTINVSGQGGQASLPYENAQYMTKVEQGTQGAVEFDGEYYTAKADNALASAESSYEGYDTAIIYIARTGAEGIDTPTNNVAGNEDKNKHYLELNDSEKQMVAYAKSHFDKILVVVNSPSVMELGGLENDDAIGAIVWVGQPGWNGMLALGDILKGTVNPSGHTVDFYMSDFTKDPTWMNFGNYSQANYAVNGNYGDATFNGARLMGYDESYLITGTDNDRAIDYAEGIYLGYKYYETAYADLAAATDAATADAWYKENVVYPFGYGLSYTTFDQQIKSVSGEITDAADGELTFTVTVTNTGEVDGKEVVQIYNKAPYTEGGIEKAAKSLVGFAKSPVIKAGESADVEVKVRVKDLASFDYNDANKNGNSGYELEEGAYTFVAGKNSHEEYDSYDFTVDELLTWDEDGDPSTPNNIYSQTDNAWEMFNTLASNWTESGDDHYLKRTQIVEDGKVADLTEQLGWLVTEDNMFKEEAFNVIHNGARSDSYIDNDNWLTLEVEKDYQNVWKKSGVPESWTQAVTDANGFVEGRVDGKAPIQLQEMLGVPLEDEKWVEFMNQFTWDELLAIARNDGFFATVGSDVVGKPVQTDTDGPGQLSDGWAWVCEVVIASTWNTELAYEQGKVVGNEGLWLNANWYGPAANTHRSPFGGRNFEYYSQDGLQGGLMCANVVKGATDKGIHVFVKHFMLNDMETSRMNVMTFATEQSIREIYARQWEYCVRYGNANGIMTSYSHIGLVSGTNYASNIQILENEWGFDGVSQTDMYFPETKIGYSGWANVRSHTLPLGAECSVFPLDGEWDASARNGKGAVMVADGEGSTETYESATQYEAVRTTVQRVMYQCVNGSNMHNGAEAATQCFSVGNTLNIQPGQAVSVDVVNDAEAVKVYGTGYKVTVTGLPAGLTYDAATDKITGTATAQGITPVTITITSTQAGLGWVDSSLTCNVCVGTYLTASSAAVTNGQQTSIDLSQSFVELVTADEATADKPANYVPGGDGTSPANTGKYIGIAFSVAGDSQLPRGLSLNPATGEITGVANAPAGQYTFDVTVTFTKVVASGAFGSARSDVDTYTAPITLTVSGETTATWITDVEINDNGDLILTWSDGYIENVGHVVGSDGQDGLPGADGQDGTDGISVTSATVNDEGELVLTLSNGQQINAGHVVGADGQDGAPGANGTNGTNGANGADGQNASSATGIAAIAVSCVAAVISVAGIAMLVLARKKANK